MPQIRSHSSSSRPFDPLAHLPLTLDPPFSCSSNRTECYTARREMLGLIITCEFVCAGCRDIRLGMEGKKKSAADQKWAKGFDRLLEAVEDLKREIEEEQAQVDKEQEDKAETKAKGKVDAAYKGDKMEEDGNEGCFQAAG